MIDVILCRHGHHDELGRVLSGRSEIALNAEGRRAAAALARSLDGRRVASLHTSPSARTMETAAAIAARHGIFPQVAGALDEVDFGAFAGRAFDTLGQEDAWHAWNAHRDAARCPGGETMAEAVARAAAYLRALPAAIGPAVCVTHCDIIRGLVVQAQGRRFADMFALACDPASSTTLSIDSAGAMRVIEVNRLPA